LKLGKQIKIFVSYLCFPMTQHELDTIIASGEGYIVEFKQNVNSDLSKELAAFANASGGRIFIGLTDDGKVQGITITNKLKSDIQSVASACDPPVDIRLEDFDKKVMIITIPEGRDKPYRTTNGFYIRTGASSIKMSRDQIISFIKSEGKVKFDELRNLEVDYPSERNDITIKHYMGIAGINTTLTPDELLSNLGVLYTDEKLVINNTGVLFFIKNPRMHIPNNAINCVLYKGNKKVDIIDKKTFDLDIITNIEEAIAFLKRHLNLAYNIKGSRREERLEIPEVVLREAVVNAVTHRDYFEKGAEVMVEIFDNRVEISNPGGLAKGLKEEDFGTKTLARNPLIAALLSRAKYIEKLGTGVPRIRQAMKEKELPEPVFLFDHFFTVILKRYNPVSELRKQLKISEAKAKRIAAILEKLGSGGKLEPEKLAAILVATSRTIRNDISLLEEAGWIKIKGSTFAREYELSKFGADQAARYF
jgi:ATP-dependent DNA helicase RecG